MWITALMSSATPPCCVHMLTWDTVTLLHCCLTKEHRLKFIYIYILIYHHICKLGCNVNIVWLYFELPVLHPQVDAQSHDGLTALGFAAAAGHLDIVNILSQNAAKVDLHTGHKDCLNKTPTL